MVNDAVFAPRFEVVGSCAEERSKMPGTLKDDVRKAFSADVRVKSASRVWSGRRVG